MRRIIQILLGGAIVLDVVYWTLWFTSRDTIASLDTASYVSFENAFPLADAWLGLTCLLALLALHRRQPTAVLWLLCAGSAGVYLGCMDLLYDLENDIFTSGSGGVFEAFVVLVTWIFSITVLTWSWRHREELLTDSGTPRAAP